MAAQPLRQRHDAAVDVAAAPLACGNLCLLQSRRLAAHERATWSKRTSRPVRHLSGGFRSNISGFTRRGASPGCLAAANADTSVSAARKRRVLRDQQVTQANLLVARWRRRAACRGHRYRRGAVLCAQIGSASAEVVTPGLRVDLLNNLACRQLVERLADRAEGNRCALVALDRTADLDGAHRTRRIGL